MDFKEVIKGIGLRVESLKDNIQTEEATKNAFIMPFIQALGYDVFNPLEVVPEFVTDIGTKKGEKIDYAIFKDNQPTILIECKHWAQNLSLHDNQLLRYFHVSKAKFGILTNGIEYRFYSDLEEPNKMDESPFFYFNICELSNSQIEELRKFHKSNFEIEKILSTASELKYINQIKSILSVEFKNPTEAFIKHFISSVYSGRATEKILLQFQDLVKKSCQQFISETITETFKSALSKDSDQTPNKIDSKSQESNEPESEEKKIETTIEEVESFYIVKSMLRGKVDLTRVSYRDGQVYFSILLDDNNRKPLCRLYLNGSKKHIGVFDSEKKETKSELKSLDDLFNFQNQIVASLDNYK